jgi:hypothetical protein
MGYNGASVIVCDSPSHSAAAATAQLLAIFLVTLNPEARYKNTKCISFVSVGIYLT